MRTDVKKLVNMAVLSALSLVLMLLIRFPIIPIAPYLIYEPADVPIIIGAFMLGPVAGLIMTIVVSVIQATLHPEGGWVGLVMHIIATGTLTVVAGGIYSKFRSFTGAIIALVAGSLSMTLIMIPSNLFFTVKFYGVPYEEVVKMLVPALIPFNLIKSFTNSIIVAMIYLPLKNILERKRASTGI